MKSRHLGVGIVLAFLMAACGSSKQAGDAPKSFEGINYPDWVLKGGGAFGGDSGRVFYGVGSVSGVKDFSLARLTADNRARADIARVFETYSASLMKDYMSATTTGGESNEEQHIENVVKTFSAQTLSGVQVVDHFFHPDGTVFSLAKLDLENFKGNLEKMKSLNAEVRDYVKKNAERVHLDLEREEAKRE